MNVSEITDLNYLVEQIKSKQLQGSADFNEFLQSTMKTEGLMDAIKGGESANGANGVSDVISLLGSALAKGMEAATNLGSQSEEQNAQTSLVSADMQRQIKEDAQMFKTFDFMQIMNQLIYGNKTDSEKQDLLNQAIQISKEV